MLPGSCAFLPALKRPGCTWLHLAAPCLIDSSPRRSLSFQMREEQSLHCFFPCGACTLRTISFCGLLPSLPRPYLAISWLEFQTVPCLFKANLPCSFLPCSPVLGLLLCQPVQPPVRGPLPFIVLLPWVGWQPGSLLETATITGHEKHFPSPVLDPLWLPLLLSTFLDLSPDTVYPPQLP